MNDFDLEQQRRTYQLCRWAFGTLAFALVLACVPSALDLLAMFRFPLIQKIRQWPIDDWIEAPVVWGSLLGATLLFGRWDHAAWQRRAGLFLVMNLVDVGMWFISRGEALGLQDWDVGHGWMRYNLGRALGWAEFSLIASLAADYLVHLGVAPAKESGKSARSMAATGALLWILLFCEQTDWRAGWPLQPRMGRAFGAPRFRPGLETLLLLNHGFRLIWTITLVQVTAMVIAATRESTRVIGEIEKELQVAPTYEPSSGWESRDDNDPQVAKVAKDELDELA
jgi:hypothetical protein